MAWQYSSINSRFEPQTLNLALNRNGHIFAIAKSPNRPLLPHDVVGKRKYWSSCFRVHFSYLNNSALDDLEDDEDFANVGTASRTHGGEDVHGIKAMEVGCALQRQQRVGPTILICEVCKMKPSCVSICPKYDVENA